jgi:hypothetical protein
MEPFGVGNRAGQHSDDENGPDENHQTVTESRDAWLDSVEEKLPLLINPDAARAQQLSVEARERYFDDTVPTGPQVPLPILLTNIISLLQPKETPRRAMDRFLGRSSGVKPKFQLKGIRARKKDAVIGEPAMQDSAKDMDSFTSTTEIVDALVSLGMAAALDEPRESFQGRLRTAEPR